MQECKCVRNKSATHLHYVTEKYMKLLQISNIIYYICGCVCVYVSVTRGACIHFVKSN